MELYRGRLIDHVQLVVADLDASRRFYEAVFNVLNIPVESNSPSHFWGDELFISTPDGPEAAGRLTGRHHIAFQAEDRETVDRFYAAGLEAGGRDNGAPGDAPTIIPVITPLSCSIRTATTSRPSITAKRNAAPIPLS